MSHQVITYSVVNPEHKQAELHLDVSMGLCDGCGSPKAVFPWPAEGVDLKAYARERMKAKIAANLGVDGYPDECLIDQTDWPNAKAAVKDEAALPESHIPASHTPAKDAKTPKVKKPRAPRKPKVK